MHFDFLLMKFYHIKTHLEKISMILFRNWYHEEKKEIGIEYINIRVKNQKKERTKIKIKLNKLDKEIKIKH